VKNKPQLSKSERNGQLDSVERSKRSLHAIAGEQIARIALMPLLYRWAEPDASLRDICT